MSVWLTLAIAQNSQSIENNKSNVTVTLKANWNTQSWDWNGAPGWLTVDGTKYTFDKDLNPNKTSSGSQTLMTKTVDVAHNSDGTKTLACSASYTTGTASGTITASASKVLDTIPRKSSLSVSNGTLGTAQTLTVTKQASAFTHTITYKCGSASGTICTKSGSTSISWTPPASLASQNTTGKSVSATFTITTYNGDTNIGSSTTAAKTFTIPSTAAFSPKCTVKIEESPDTPYSATYGAPVKGLSKLKVTVTPTLAYGSAIKSYSTTVNGTKYTASSFTTSVLTTSGTITATATVKDARENSGSGSGSITGVLEYSPPAVDKFTVQRCDKDGVPHEDDKGDHVKVVISYHVSPLNLLNSSQSYIQYKKSSETDYTNEIDLGQDDIFTVTDHEVIFEADTGSSYDILLVIRDDLSTTRRPTVVSTAFTLQHWKDDGTGMAVGKISELSNVFDVGMQTRHMGGILQPILESGTDFNTVMIPNTYTLKSCNNAAYVNCPITSGTGTLTIESCGEEGQIHQLVSVCSKTNALVYERFYYQSAWGEWVCTSDYNGVLLWEGVYYMSAAQTVTLPTPISKLPNGIILVFSRYSSGVARDYHFNHAFVHKAFVAAQPGVGSTFLMTTDGTFSVMATKYLYIHDDHIAGNANNEATGTGTSGVTYENNGFVLRYVIGV